MVASGYYVERAVFLTLASILLVLSSYVSYTIYLRVKGSSNNIKLIMSCLGTASALFAFIEAIDFECVFGIFDIYLISFFTHLSASFLFCGAALLTIMHLELVYKFMHISTPPSIRPIGFACGIGHWVLGNVCILLIVTVKDEICLGLFFLVYVVALSALTLFVNFAICRVIGIVNGHIKESKLTTAPELEKVIRQSRTFQYGVIVVAGAAIIVLAMRSARALHLKPLVPGPTNPLYMDPNVYSFSGELLSAIILGLFVANIWMLVGERHAANNSMNASKSAESQLSGGRSLKSVKSGSTKHIPHKHTPSTDFMKNNTNNIHHAHLNLMHGNDTFLSSTSPPISPPSPVNSSHTLSMHGSSGSGGGGEGYLPSSSSGRMLSKTNSNTTDDYDDVSKKDKGSPLPPPGRALTLTAEIMVDISHQDDLTDPHTHPANHSGSQGRNDALAVVVVEDLE